MKVAFLSQIPENINKPFAIYEHNEVLSSHHYYIDIREIIKNRNKEWFNEINKSHADLSKNFLNYTRWWWITGMSRLDARPWGQEHLLKPFFFSRAILEWLALHQDVKEIFLIGCEVHVAIYLKEFKEDLVIENSKGNPFLVFSIFFCKHLIISILKLIKNAAHIARHHLFRKMSFIKSDVLVLYELFADTSLTLGYKYYYDGLFESPDILKNNTIGYGCIDGSFSPVNKLRSETNKTVFFLLDNIYFFGFIRSFFLNLYLIFLTTKIALEKPVCKFGNYKSLHFWPNYLLSELSRTTFLNAICCYHALSIIFTLHKYRYIIYPYEEKTIERAILFSSKEKRIPAIGYIPHPQHSLILSLRDTYKPYSPKPEGYAVCGQKYVDYLRSWCDKDPNLISVWGSKKSSEQSFTIKKISRGNLRILLFISHPNELSVFYSWLRAEQRLSIGINYFLRVYKTVNYRKFSDELNNLTSQFNFVKEVNGDLKNDLNLCDLAAFCATSAGLLAVNYGYLSVHLCLDDFFSINPCFDDLSTMLSCTSAAQFADLLARIYSLDSNSLFELYKKQRNFVNQIFSPIEAQNIERGISKTCLN